jgi:hypothetical protein
LKAPTSQSPKPLAVMLKTMHIKIIQSIMKEIICDTNIWYGLGDGSIIKPNNSRLIATWNNMVEIGFSHQNIKEKINVELVQKAAKAILVYADEIIENDPFAYSANKFEPTLDIKTKSLKHILQEIVKDGLPSENTFQENCEAYKMFMKIKDEFAGNLNSEKPSIRESVYVNNIEKNKFKKSDCLQIDEQAYSILLYIERFLDKEHELNIIIQDNQDFKNTIELIKSKFELYVFTKQKFLKKWVLDKDMNIDSNDFYDLLNLVYVEKGQYYWTKERRWISAMQEAGMVKYIWS